MTFSASPHRAEIVGVIRCHRTARYRNGPSSTTLRRMILDAIDPLPPHELWTVETEEPSTLPGRGSVPERPRGYRSRSGRLPAGLSGFYHGDRVRFSATIEDFKNGVDADGTIWCSLGGFMSRVSAVELLPLLSLKDPT